LNSTSSILALVTEAFGGTGGIAQYNRDFLRAITGCGTVSLIAVVPRHAPDPVNPPARIHQLAPHAGRVSYSVAALHEAFSKPFDAVFCGHLFMAPLALLIARLKGAKLIIQIHGVEAWQRPGTLCRIAVEAADLVLCVSRYSRARVLKWASIPPERAHVLPNTVRAAFEPGDGSALRTAWGLQGKSILLSVGRMSAYDQYKGNDRVIRAIPQLVMRGHDVVYVIVGEGNDQNRLQALADTVGVGSRVRFVGAASPDVLVDAYRMADVFVMPSTGEGFGIAFLEAMACGTPTLGLAIAGAKDALADGELGVLTSEAELSDAISRLIAAPKADPWSLAEAVAHRFGSEAFAAHACATIGLHGNAA
jgi:phosphatidylinositol alpha-1,6-mannosyltransferase